MKSPEGTEFFEFQKETAESMRAVVLSSTLDSIILVFPE
jgi:hypothetical protein